MRSILRIVLLSVALMVIAAPGPAQYEGCWECRQFCDFDGYCYQWCGNPPNNSWGRETCGYETWGRIQVCRARGNGCYYFEVQG